MPQPIDEVRNAAHQDKKGDYNQIVDSSGNMIKVVNGINSWPLIRIDFNGITADLAFKEKLLNISFSLAVGKQA